VLIEGYWNEEAGLHAQQIVAALPSACTDVVVRDLSRQVALWGREVADERYMVIAAQSVNQGDHHS
jgi:hypothetical protein